MVNFKFWHRIFISQCQTFNSCQRKAGQALVELLVAIGLTAILLPTLLTALVASRSGKAQETQRLQAIALLREAEEAVRSVREQGWNSFAVNGIFHPQIAGSSWTLASGPQTINGFTRQVVISNVQRDSNGTIVESGGIVDTSTKKVVSTVSWSTPVASLVESTNYYHRYLNNTAWTQTTQAEFDLGTKFNTVSTNNAGGEIELAAGTGGSWASPTVIAGYNNSGNADGNDVFILDNYAYLVTNNGGGNPDLAIIDISNPSSPIEMGTLNLNTNVNSVFVVGNHAYLATSHNSKELIIVDVSNKTAPTELSSLNLGSWKNATSVFVSDNFAYLTKQAQRGGNRELYIIDVSNPTTPAEVGTFEVGDDVQSVYISGNFAYLASSHNRKELLIVDVTNKSNPTEAGSYNIPSRTNATDVFVDGTRVYLVTKNNRRGSEFYILDSSDPANVTPVGSFEINNTVNGVFVSGNLAFLATNLNNKELVILDISDPANPVELGSANLDGNGNKLFVMGDHAYVATTRNNRELAIVAGGSGLYQTFGTFESSTFDAGSEVAFNYLTFTVVEPINTNINLQIAINNDGSTWNYIGPDGTSSSYYEIPEAIPLSWINGQYFRYKAYFKSDGSSTPILEDVSINYSP